MLRSSPVSRRAAIGAFAATIALANPGCDDTCAGADCGGLYPRAALGRFDGGQLTASEVDPREPAATLEGADADGFDWAIVGAADGAVIGVPETGEVRRHGFGDGVTASIVADDAAGARFGAALAVGPGLDGGTRLVVGAPSAASGPLRASGGVAYVYEAQDASLSGLDSPARVVSGTRAGDRLGEGAWACGDLDADGAPDWAVGSGWIDGGTDGASVPLAGGVYLGLSASLPLGRDVAAETLPLLRGAVTGAALGAALACDRSLDGDGFADLVVAAPYADVEQDGETTTSAGTVAVHRGGAAIGTAALTLSMPDRDAWFGAALAVGDLDGDGAAELAVGAPGVDRPGDAGDTAVNDVAGAVYVYDGATLAAALLDGEPPPPARTLQGEFARGRFGASLVIADLDGDGVGDLAVGAPGHDPTGAAGAPRAGAATVWWGPYTAWSEIQFASDAPVTLVAERQYLETGRVLAATSAPAGEPAALLVLVREPALGE